MRTISEEEYDELRQKAQAWDDHIHRRLHGGHVPAQFNITYLGDDKFELDDPVIISPFGKFSMPYNVGGKRQLNMIPGDRVTLDLEVKLSIN